MALQFTQASSNKVTVTNPLTITGSFSYVLWIRQRGAPNNSEGTNKGAIDLLVFFDNWFCNVPRATTAAQSDVTNANLFPDGNWVFLAVTYSEASGVRFYRGTQTAPPSEMTYFATVAGSGATTSESGDLYICNRGAANILSPAHDIATSALFNAELPLNVIRDLWNSAPMLPSCKMLFELGFNGVGQQPDLSGSRNAGTVTGASVKNHPYANPYRPQPRRKWQGYDGFGPLMSRRILARAPTTGGFRSRIAGGFIST